MSGKSDEIGGYHMYAYQTQETTYSVQSYYYLHGRVILMIGQIQQQQGINIQFQNRNNVNITNSYSHLEQLSLSTNNYTLYIRPT